MSKASTLAQRIIRSRGLTYRQVADEIGITAQGVYAIASGRAEGKTGRYAVAKVLGLEVSDLWPEDSDQNKAA